VRRIEGYTRHDGHADSLRERVEGAVGDENGSCGLTRPVAASNDR
jgi:hypothetical protein